MYRVLATQWRIFRNEKRRDERREVLTVAVMRHRWMLGGRDDRDTEIGDIKVMVWWHLILGGAQHCHLVSYCQHHHHRFTKDRLTNIGCLLNMSYGYISLVVSLSFWSLSKNREFWSNVLMMLGDKRILWLSKNYHRAHFSSGLCILLTF